MLKEVITIKKILFGITSLTLGGAERVLVDISNKLSEKYNITIFSIYDNGELKNDLNKNVKFKALYNCRYDELTKLQKMWIPIKILLFSKIIYNKKIKFIKKLQRMLILRDSWNADFGFTPIITPIR